RIILVEFVPGTAPTARPVGAQFGFRLKPDSGNRICKRHDVSGAKPGHGRTRRIKSIAMQFECELEDAARLLVTQHALKLAVHDPEPVRLCQGTRVQNSPELRR